MAKCYINGIGCVSAQETTNPEIAISSYEALTNKIVFANKPKYRDYIPANLLRRMSSSVKMGITASKIAMSEANIEMPDAIITGTGMGCIIDSEKFLTKIIKDNEQFLTPTPFIQSTHNTVGAQIALGLKCKAYNVTYVHDSVSFESAAMDAMMMLDENESGSIVIGGTEELEKHTNNLLQIIGVVKSEEEISGTILDSKTSGVLSSEGAQFFVLQESKSDSTYAELIDLEIYDFLSEEDINKALVKFLKNNALSPDDIDLVFLGKNGDYPHDKTYDNLGNTLFEETQQVYSKHLSGDYNTASAFALWSACKIIKTQEIPENMKLNQVKTEKINHVLLYNNNRGGNHSFTLIKSC